jgi:hypothetical protein
MARQAGLHNVNGVIDLGVELNGCPVEVEGVLGLQSEGYFLQHYPKAERRPNRCDDGPIYQSSIWLATGTGSVQLNRSVLERWLGKRVRIHGIVHSTYAHPTSEFHSHGGYGPYGFWPAQIEPYSVQRITADQRREHEA